LVASSPIRIMAPGMTWLTFLASYINVRF